MKRLRLSQIRTDKGTQTRARIDEATAAEYAERMIAGDRFPPVTVFQDDGTFVLADGFHRLRAAKLAKYEKIEAEIRAGTRLDALKFSLAAIHRHGLRRTTADKHFATALALREFPDWSDRAIAKLVTVSAPFVGSIRRQLEMFTVEARRVGLDGRRRKLPTESRSQALQLIPQNDEDREARCAVLEIARKLASVEDMIKDVLARYPDAKPVLRGFVSKVRQDLAFYRLRIKPTIDLFYELRGQKPVNWMGRAYRMIFFNRTCFSGLWHDNPIGGRMQTSRYKVFTNWTGQELIREIRVAPDLLKGRTVVTCLDGAEYVRRHPQPPKYCDPPYFERGAGLYQQRMALADHLRLADALREAGNWVLSYDDCPSIAELYSWAQCHVISALYRVHQKKSKCVRGTELVIVPGRNGSRPRRKQII